MQFGQTPPQNRFPPIQPSGFFSGLKPLPIILGIVADIVSTFALSTAYYILFIAQELRQSGVSEDALSDYWNSSEGVMASLIIGAIGTGIGGYFAGRRAGLLEMKHGAFVGFGSILTGLVLQSLGSDAMKFEEWQLAIAYAAAIPAGALGGSIAEFLRSARHRPGGNWPPR
jgi:ABC-type branched-subunit amino acid transport system permease subunit